jgi:hypothetical protein
MVSFLDSPGSFCCTRIQPIVSSYPNSLGVPLRKLVTYPPGSGLLILFGRPSADDRLNYKSNESPGMHAAAPKSERQTATLDQR